jgi:hypothetical protein
MRENEKIWKEKEERGKNKGKSKLKGQNKCKRGQN